MLSVIPAACSCIQSNPEPFQEADQDIKVISITWLDFSDQLVCFMVSVDVKKKMAGFKTVH